MYSTPNLDTQLKSMSSNIMNMIVFDKFKTGKPIFDAFITTCVLTAITYLFQFINDKTFVFIHQPRSLIFI